MATLFAIHWWHLALRGLLAICFGLIAIFLPGITLLALTLLFGAYAMVGGIVSLLAAIHASHRRERWWLLLAQGTLGILAALFTLLWPAITLAVLVLLLGAWFVVGGVLEIIAAIQLRRVVSGEWLLIVAGVASVLFGCLLFAAPGPGAVVLAWWIGAYALIIGVVILMLAMRLRRHESGHWRLQHV